MHGRTSTPNHRARSVLAILVALAPIAPLAPVASGSPAQEDAPPRPRGGADPSEDAFELGSPPSLSEGTTEEEMWPAASAEGWRQPCLVRWQRSFDDALEVARAQNRPLLVAVNMDGEIASEHFAGIRYRDEETAALLSRYVCVVASVYRHTPRDHDPSGRRVECPRFGTVTCGEHIQAERELYGRYFDGRRIAPRHIVLDLEGRETFDVYFAWDTSTVVRTFVKGLEGWPEPTPSPEPTRRNLARSRDVADREVLEAAWLQGDRAERRELLLALQEEEAADQVELLRAAIFGLDLELARMARRALARCETEPALDLIAEALKVPLEPAERDELLAAVERMAETTPRAKTLAALHSGLALGSQHIDERSARELASEYEANAASIEERAAALAARPDDPGELLALAEAFVERADEGDPGYAPLFLADARDAAREAARRGAQGPRLEAILAVSSWGLGEREAAREHAVAAVEGGLLRPDDSPGVALSNGVRERVLWLFGHARRRQIRRAYRAGEEWDPAWLSDVNAAYTILSTSPDVEEWTLVEYHDFLAWIGATPRANAVLEDALERFPDSAVLHERLRSRLLWEGGPAELERAYGERLAGLARVDGAEAGALEWFAGYASLVAAEHYRRRGRFEEALPAYERAVAHYELRAAGDADARDDVDHWISIAHAGRARIDMERGELEAASASVLDAIELRPASAAIPDGLGITAVATAKMLRTRLAEADPERAERLQAALDSLDASQLATDVLPPVGLQPGGPAPGSRRDDDDHDTEDDRN